MHRKSASSPACTRLIVGPPNPPLLKLQLPGNPAEPLFSEKVLRCGRMELFPNSPSLTHDNDAFVSNHFMTLCVRSNKSCNSDAAVIEFLAGIADASCTLETPVNRARSCCEAKFFNYADDHTRLGRIFKHP